MRLTIGSRVVAPDRPLFTIAEIGLNHGGSVVTALRLVREAASAGASAVKLQSLRGHTLVAPDCPPPAHVDVPSLQAFFQRFELDEDAHRAVLAEARRCGVAFISTPFDEDAVAMLDRLGCDAIKIASGDITHGALIDAAARTGRPLIISTGMSDLDDVAQALEWAQTAGATDLALLHCVSAYPVPGGHANLGAIATLERTFKVPVGLSDHGTDSLHVAIAVTLGACIYERHIRETEEDDAIDAAVSSTPSQFAAAVTVADRVRADLGDGRRTCGPSEKPNRTSSRRGLYAARDLSAGALVSRGDVVALRPAEGLSAARWRELVGVRLRRAVRAGERFIEADVCGRMGVTDAA